jgi:uncharacterized protein with GYD domain
MPMYVGLMKLTAKGAADIKGWPGRVEAAKQTWEAMGGKAVAVLATMGQYDMVTVGEAPSDEAVATWAVGVSAQGTMTLETLRGFTMDELGGMIAKLP